MERESPAMLCDGSNVFCVGEVITEEFREHTITARSTSTMEMAPELADRAT